MQKLIKLDPIKIGKAANRVIEYLHPECIFIPVEKDNIFQIQQKAIKKEQFVVAGGTYSSVSGVITSSSEKRVFNNKLVSAIQITNNFKEEVEKKSSSIKDLHVLTKDTFLKQLKEISGYKTNLLYEELSIEETKCLVIKCFDNEPLLSNAYMHLVNDKEAIVNTVDSMLSILGIDRAIFLLKDSCVDLIPEMTDLLSTYPNMQIKLMNDVYPVKDNDLITEYIFQAKKEDNTLVLLDIEQIIDIYTTMKRRKKRTEKYITISGNAITEPCVIYTKLGTNVKEVLEQFITLKTEDVSYTTNSPLYGYKLDSIHDLIITKELEGIFINYNEEAEKDCISCGKCYEVCPKKINPRAIDFSKCIRCGLCNYVCPSRINLIKEEDDE